MRFAIPLLLAAVIFPCRFIAHGQIIDQNNNGIDDVWEAVYNASTLDPNADTDGDGFTNAQEAAAGTDPRNPNSHPPTVTITAGNGNITLTWNTVPGKQYRVQTATTSGAGAVWSYLGAPYYGVGATLTATFGLNPSQPHFFRVEVGDVDSDGDGVSDWAELRLGFDPFNADTYNTGLGDRQTIINALASPNEIAVTAEHAVASTAYGDVGVLTFTRSGNFTPLKVLYTVGGTAVAGQDYAALSGYVIFPEAVNTVRVNVAPLASAAITINKTVIVKLGGTGYQIDPDTNSAMVTINILPTATGQVVDECWDNLTGYDLDAVPFDSTLTTRRFRLTTLEAPVNTGHNQYGSRIRGYITAPTTGTYTFWIAADDIGEFRLSTDDQMANLVLRCDAESWTSSREWNKYPTQQSAAIALTAGQRYAFEMKFFQGYGGDNLAVGWLKPGETGTVPSEIVPGSVLSNYTPPFSPTGLTTLYFGALNQLSGATTTAQGFSSLRLLSDNSAGILSVSTSGLSGPPTSIALRGPANPGQTGALIQDFVHATPQTDGTYLWKIGAPANVTALKNGQVYVNIATAAHPAGEIAGWLLLSAGTGAFTPPAAPPALSTAAPSAGDAARLMTQATFGANAAGIAAIQRDGYAAWIDDQLNAPPTLTQPFINTFAASGQNLNQDTFQESWWRNAITAPDQLRQRVAFALSEIMVVSDIDGNLTAPNTLASYYDTLLQDAFGNYRKLLEDVTLSPVMGDYLNMLHNDKADPDTGTVPNENYGREAMQLFAIGLNKLNPDGSLLLDSNSLPIPTYEQTEVEGFSHVYTGWNFAQTGQLQWDYVSSNYRQPMMLVPEHHDQNPKHLLDGVVLPAGQSGAQDLKDALDMLSDHPNTGPFFCRQLIQKLVTSNPSPGYIYRVAKVFANNGQGVRGDLRAVVRAILLDYEARSATMITNDDFGKEREPVIRLANVYRAFNARSYNNRYEIDESDISQNFGQAVLDSPSVFNFFSPNYTLTGEIASAGLVCPEFQITTATTVVFSSNELRSRIAQSVSSSYPAQIGIDLTSYRALASNPTALVNSLNTLLLSGQMSSGLQTQTINAVKSVVASDTLTRAQTAVQIISTSPEFCIQK